MSNFITLQSAIENLYRTVEERKISGVRRISKNGPDIIRRIAHGFDSDVFEAEWERGWGSNASLRISTYDDMHRGEPCVSVRCQIGWSSTNREIVGALAAVTLYREVIELAAALQHQWDCWPVSPTTESDKDATQPTPAQ